MKRRFAIAQPEPDAMIDGMGRESWLVVISGFVLIMIDGFDLASLAYSAPFIIAEWHLTSKAGLAAAFSAGLIGMCIGSPVLGHLADRIGRTRAVAASALLTGIFTAGTALTSSVTALLILRFASGLGIGGLASCLIAYTAEHVPTKVRAFMMCLMFCGITVGAALPGLLTAWLVPSLGWQVLFAIGGVAALVSGVLFYSCCPESARFSSTRISDVAGEPQSHATFGILSPPLARLTVLLWLCIALAFAGYYAVSSWLPTLLVGWGYPAATAALATAAMQFGGAVGGLAVGALIDRWGLRPLPFAALGCVAALAFVGPAAGNGIQVVGLLFFLGVALLGTQLGLTVTAGILYPTGIRGSGVGWASATGRIGAIFGPLAGGALIDGGIAGAGFLLVAAAPYVGVFITSLALSRSFICQANSNSR